MCRVVTGGAIEGIPNVGKPSSLLKGPKSRASKLESSNARIAPPILQIMFPPKYVGVWDIWGSYYDIPKAIFYLLKGNPTS